LDELYVPGYPFIQWDIYASLKFQGPQYGSSDTGKSNKILCDQVILVRENNKLNEPKRENEALQIRKDAAVKLLQSDQQFGAIAGPY
jgi:hypothetical protein